MCSAGCAGKKNDVVPNTPVPISGTYSGQFKLYHVDGANTITRIDSTNLILTMETATGFKVTGDTTKLHAGSYGSYEVNSTTSQIFFADKTFPLTGTPAKIHLSGPYNYEYNGTTLAMLAYGPQDTLQYYYQFTRTGN